MGRAESNNNSIKNNNKGLMSLEDNSNTRHRGTLGVPVLVN